MNSDETRDAPAALPPAVIAVATFRRPAGLARLLPELVRQVEDYPGSADVVVVDNDPAGAASAQVQEWRGRRVRYVHEPRPGIAAARNAALAEAGPAEVLLFIDDDEVPRPQWLETMVRFWSTWGCAAVSGPVLARFEGGTLDAWSRGSGLFARLERPTGASVGGASSGNLLLHLDTLRRLNLTFDERFGLSGGSDTMLTHQLARLGGVLRWCDEAEVVEYNPVERLSRAWALRRCYRTGNDWSRVALALTGTRRQRVAERVDLLARGAWRIFWGLARQVRGLATSSPADQGAGACMVATGRGVISGALGTVAVEYGRQPAGGSA